MDERPVGVFDSGLGGLTAIRQLERLLPGEKLVYFGDTARVPYGGRSAGTLQKYVKEDVAFLLSKGVKAILCACGTASSNLPAGLIEGLPVPFVGVIEASAAAAVQAAAGGPIGVIATAATIKSGAYEKAIRRLCPGAQITALACPLLVPLIENGYVDPDDPITGLVLEEYLPALRAAGVRALILGCTHYPLISAAIARRMGPGVTLIDSGAQGALALRALLQHRGLLCGRPAGAHISFYVSDSGENFAELASLFLGREVRGEVHPFAQCEGCALPAGCGSPRA